MSATDRVKVAILGASGYSGIEAVRLLAFHPFVELSVLTSEHYVGREVAQVYRHLAGLDLPAFEELRPDLIKGRAEVVLCCLPERTGTAVIPELLDAGIKVIDFSADFRLKDPEAYRATYGAEHSAPHLLKQAVYGLTEFHRKEIRGARLIANPGCYPTGTLLGTLPLITRDLVDPSSIIVDAKSGTTGARRTAQIEQLFAEVNDNFSAYKVGNHRHAPEMEQEIAATLGREVPLMFVPHLLPLNRGILSSIFLRPRGGTTTEDVRAAFEAAYPKARFIRLLTPQRDARIRRSRRPAPPRTGAVSGICYLRAASGCVAVYYVNHVWWMKH
jgi:N-acetyl-gamma-glutamyl-phosphate reductase